MLLLKALLLSRSEIYKGIKKKVDGDLTRINNEAGKKHEQLHLALSKQKRTKILDANSHRKDYR